jgi:hypothetical protein
LRAAEQWRRLILARRTSSVAGRILLCAALAVGTSAEAQTIAPSADFQRVDCRSWRPAYDFRRVTSDSVRVLALDSAGTDLVREAGASLIPPRIPRDRLDYDVVLDVPRLCIDQLLLRVDSLTVRVSLDVNVANMVRVMAGAGVAIGHVNLSLRHVRATALLAVDLTPAVRVVDEVMAYLEAHPEILARVLEERIRQERREERRGP